MIDDAFLGDLEGYTGSLGNTNAAEIIRNARRYLALRNRGLLLDPDEGWVSDNDLDAAADRLLEGGE